MEILYYLYLVVIFSIFLILKFVLARKPNLPPGPLAIPIIGHLHLIKQPLHQCLGALSSKYGPVMHLRFGSQSTLVVSSPSAVEECFTKNDVVFANRTRSMAADHLAYNYTAILLAPYGDLWRSLRRLTMIEVFSNNRLQKTYPILESEVRYILRQLFDQLTGANQKVIELKQLFSLLTTNLMMRVVAGRRGVDETADMEAANKFLSDYKDRFSISLSSNLCDYFPILRLIDYKGAEKKVKRLQKRRDEYLQNLMDEFRSKRTSSSPEADTTKDRERMLIETLLSLQDSEPEFYSDDVVKSIIMVMFVAGVETTSTTLGQAMSLLLDHPTAMQKLRAEIDCNVDHGRLMNDSDLVKLPYLRCIISETLRLHPTAPLLVPHLSSENCTIGGYDILRGTTLMVNAWAMHRDPKLWEEPTKFKPERFEQSLGEKERFKYIPFGMGRRACPGAVMAVRTISVVLGSLIQCFDFEKTTEQKGHMNQHHGPILSHSDPLGALCSPRQSMIHLLSKV